MDVFATKNVTRKTCDKTHKGKFLKRASLSTAKKPKHPTKPKTEPRNCDRREVDLTCDDYWAGWCWYNDDGWDLYDDYFELTYKDENELLCLVG